MRRLQSLAVTHPVITYRSTAVALAAVGMALIAAGTGRPVTVVLDGAPRTVVAHARTVGGVLREAGVRLAPGDVSLPAPDAPAGDAERIEVRRARPLRVEVDSKVTEVISAASRPENALADAGIRLYPGDRVWVDGLPHSPGGGGSQPIARIRVERGYSLTLDQRGSRRRLLSAAPTVGEALWSSGVRLRSADDVFPSAGASLGGPTGIRFAPASAILISADGREVESWAAGENVGEALALAGVALVGLDYATPGLEEPLPEGGTVRVVRVVETVEVERDTLPFQTRWEPSKEIEIDRQALVDPGETGIVARRTRIRLEDGQERGRTEEASWVAVEPRDRIMGYGTKIVIRTLNTPSGPIEYWRAVPMYATSYSPCRLGVPNYCSITMANGEPLKHGNVAFVVRWYRVMRGQYVYVPGYGTGKISDTGGGIPGRRWIDLGYSDDDYVSWHQWVTVYFRTPVPPEGLILWVLE